MIKSKKYQVTTSVSEDRCVMKVQNQSVLERIFKTFSAITLIFLLLLGASVEGVGQVTIFSENFGTSTAFPVGWSTGGTVVWVGSTNGGTTYPGASGSGSMLHSNTVGEGTLTYCNNLSTIGYSNITVIWGAARRAPNTSSFYYSINGGASWTQVTFTDVSANNNLSTWALVNGGVRLNLPSDAEGVSNLCFQWRHTVDNISGTWTGYRLDDFSVQGVGIPVANFTANTTSVAAGGSVNFTDNSTNSPTSWSWSFPGGTPSSSTSQNPTVTYNTPGVYNVTLTATNAAGSDAESKTGYITVSVPPVCASQTIWSEQFNYSNGTETGVGSPTDIASWSTNNGGMDVRSNVLRNRNVTATWNTTTINISGYSNVSVNMDISETGTFESDDNIICEYNIGSGWVALTNGSYTDDFGSATATVSNLNASSLQLRVRADCDGSGAGDEDYFLDNISITGTPVVTVNDPTDLALNGGVPTTVTFTGTGATTYFWTNNNTNIGLGTSGVGNISFTTTNVSTTEVATITVTPSNGTCTGSPQTFTITVNPACTNPTAGGTIAATQTICSGGDPAAFTSTGLPTGHTGTVEYKWQSSTSGSGSGFSDITPGATGLTYDVPSGLTQTTWYKRLSKVTCSGVWATAGESNVLEVTVNPAPILTSISANPISACAGSNVTIAVSGLISGLNTISYDYTIDGLTTSSSIDMTPSGGVATTTLNNLPAGNYQVKINSISVNGCTTNFSTNNTANWTIDPEVIPTFVQLGPYCAGTTPDVLPGTSANGITGSWSPANISTSTPGSTIYTFTPVAGLCAISTTMSVTINALPTTFNVTGGGEYCFGGSPVAIGLSGSEAGVNYQLYRDGATLVETVAGTGSAISFTSQTTTGTYTVVATNATTGCNSDMSGSAVVTAITVVLNNPDPVICIHVGEVFIDITSSTGNPTNYDIDFDTNANNAGFGDVSNWQIENSKIKIVVPNGGWNVNPGTYSGKLKVRKNSPSNCYSEEYDISVTISTAGGSVTTTVTASANPVCTGTPVTFTAIASGVTDYRWTVNGNLQTETSSVFTFTPVNGDVVAGYAFVPCEAAVKTSSNEITITVQPVPAATISGNATICNGQNTPLQIDFTGTGPWEVTTVKNGSDPVTVANIIDDPYIFNVTAAGTYTISAFHDAVCAGATYGSATVTVNPLPTITLTSTLGEVCYSDVVATLEYSATTGSPNLYSIDFDGTAEGQGFADVTNVNLTGGIIEITVPDTGVADTYHAVLTVNNSSTSCVSAAYNINIIIHPLPDTSEIQTN